MSKHLVSAPELEIRGKFHSRSDLQEFLFKMNQFAVFDKHRKRLSVLYTTGSNGKELQIRLHNKELQIVLKIGKHASTTRQETVITMDHENFLPAINLFYSLGFKKGVVARAEDWFFHLDGIEVKVTVCDEEIMCWEIEAIKTTQNLKDLLNLAKKLNLKPMNEQELEKYWRWMQKNANKPFSTNTIRTYYNAYLKELSEKK